MVSVMIGIDPHKASHTAAAIDPAENELGQLRVRAAADQVDRLLEWAAGVAGADLGGGERRRAGLSARPAAVGGWGAGAGRAAQAGRPGAAVGHRRYQQERPQRCPLGGCRGAAIAGGQAGRGGGPSGGHEAVGEAPPGPGTGPHPGGVPAARRAVRAGARRRDLQRTQRRQGGKASWMASNPKEPWRPPATSWPRRSSTICAASTSRSATPRSASPPR